MLPHKTSRGQAAFNRLATYDGIPSPFDTQKRMVVPEAIRATKLGELWRVLMVKVVFVRSYGPFSKFCVFSFFSFEQKVHSAWKSRS